MGSAAAVNHTACRSVLSQLTSPSTRADVLAWYVTTSTLGSSIGSEASGRMIHFLQARDGWTPVDAYHALFWIYTAMGIVNALLVLPLTDACELPIDQDIYAQVPQDEDESVEEGEQNDPPEFQQSTPTVTPAPRSWATRTRSWFATRFAQISAPTRAVMYKLWFLLTIDSLADGMVPYSLTNYFMDLRFHPSKSTLGDVTSIAYLLGAVGAVFAGPLAKRIGLINTMVFTHVPSSAAVLFFPFPPVFWLTAGLLLLRTGLNNMDQAPRSAFIAAVVKPEERTAVMGITSMVRTLAAMAGPTITGFLAASDRFWIAFVVAGICRLAYDFGLYAMFVNMKLYQHERKAEPLPAGDYRVRERDEEDAMEMQSLADSDNSTLMDEDVGVESKPPLANGGSLQVPVGEGLERVRSRSPHRSSDLD